MSGNMINETDNDGRDLRETVAISPGMWYKRDRECARCPPGTCSLQEVITMKKIIATTNAPAAIGPYSQAIDCGTFVVTSGQVPFDPATGEFVPGGITEQTRQVLTNIKAILTEAGLTMDNVVKTTVFLQNMGDFAAMNAVYAEFFTEGQYPARSAVEVGALPKGALVEIETICVK